jgi:class 3 adenylate cyclase
MEGSVLTANECEEHASEERSGEQVLLQPQSDSGVAADRQTTVLFADLSGSTRLYEAAGDKKALDVIGRCIYTLSRAAEAAGGRVIKTIGDEIMALFATPDHAADAAMRMQTAIDALPLVGGQKLAVRIGFQAGPVIQRDNDVFGDTVNLASRLAEQATREQVLTTTDTVSLLSPAIKNTTRRLYDITVRGKLEDIALCELLWRKSPDITQFPGGEFAARRADLCLRLLYRGRELVLKRRVESITLGRDPTCTFVIVDPMSSRHHCVIERRQDKFVLADHSSNGTYVSSESDGTETVLRREELALRGHGRLSFGHCSGQSQDVLEYWCMTDSTGE